ncbi:hypothetical protein GCM10009721_21200 [Terrabacter tumescens]|uniref:Ricin B lectin domain-containing protein n=1 Tax=Terrabacter tumescens TaxID=60443 RepID=A0ABQ2HZT0_9MICO|nr:RICIN domain-containing protein [Terrabacter tumescens]GGM94693.1 hypothetical protein GCM10009721_21200 [Terrabacter tumescens]
MAASAADNTITEITFNNVSASVVLNAAPDSSSDVDDVTITPDHKLYLPASANPAALSGWLKLGDGSTKAFTSADYTVAPVAGGGKDLTFTDSATTVHSFQSSKVPSMFIKTVNGLPWIETTQDNADVGGAMALVGPDASVAPTYNGILKEMKGRGNSTWIYPKKPYQIKLDKNTELASGAGAAKTWVLLANYLDASLVRNELSYNLEGALLKREGLNDYSIKGRMIDLFIDGNFRGSYLLAEKVQVGPTRVDITDLDKANSSANPGLDLGTIAPTKASLTDSRFAGLSEAQYVNFPNVAPDYTKGGYLLEMDFVSRAREEKSYFVTKRGTGFTVKSPEVAHPDEVSFVAQYMQKLENAIYSDGSTYTSYIDVPSFANYYALQELIANDDAFKSSTFMYLNNGGKLVAGPVWDCDRTLGAQTGAADPAAMHVASFGRAKPQWIKALMAHSDFRSAVQKAYRDMVTPEVSSILAGDGALSTYASEVADSAALNKLRWTDNGSRVVVSPTPAGDIATLRTYLTQRHAGMTKIIGNAAFLQRTRLADGVYTIANGRLNVDVAAASTLKGAKVQLYAPNTSEAQKFTVKRGTDSYYTITNVNSGQVLDLAGAVAANGTKVWQYPANGSRAQQWAIGTYDGVNFTVASPLGGSEAAYVLQPAGASTTSGTSMQVWEGNGSAAQKFGFSSALVENRAYTIASKLNSNKVLEVAGSSTANGANIRIWDSLGTRGQRYTLRHLYSDVYQVLTGTTSGRAVDVARGAKTPGTNVWQWQSNTTAAQQWSIRPTGDGDGSYYLVSKLSGLYLDVAGAKTTNGTNVWTYTGNKSNAQKFFIK